MLVAYILKRYPGRIWASCWKVLIAIKSAHGLIWNGQRQHHRCRRPNSRAASIMFSLTPACSSSYPFIITDICIVSAVSEEVFFPIIPQPCQEDRTRITILISERRLPELGRPCSYLVAALGLQQRYPEISAASMSSPWEHAATHPVTEQECPKEEMTIFGQPIS